MFIASLPSVVATVLYAFVVPESFRFMVLKGKERQLQRWLDRANGSNPRVAYTAAEIIDFNPTVASQRAQGQSNSGDNIVRRLLRQRSLLFYVLVLSYLWAVDAFLYYGLTLFSTSVAGNKYHNFLWSGQF